MNKQWAGAQKTVWRRELLGILSCCFSRWPSARKVKLLWSNRKVPGVFSLCDRPSFTIGLFSRARRMSATARQETLIHECCHLQTNGRHGHAWRRSMNRAAMAADVAGKHRLATMIRRDAALYDHRSVTESEIVTQMRFLLQHGQRREYSWIRRAISDWAGWNPQEFERQVPWLRRAWSELSRTCGLR
jgi:hypothetical protein